MGERYGVNPATLPIHPVHEAIRYVQRSLWRNLSDGYAYVHVHACERAICCCAHFTTCTGKANAMCRWACETRGQSSREALIPRPPCEKRVSKQPPAAGTQQHTFNTTRTDIAIRPAAKLLLL